LGPVPIVVTASPGPNAASCISVVPMIAPASKFWPPSAET
jgi:hypothetical protein